jgi:hypothetical protein
VPSLVLPGASVILDLADTMSDASVKLVSSLAVGRHESARG